MEEEKVVEASPGELENRDETNIGFLCHISGLLGLSQLPGSSIIGPLIIWLQKKDSSPAAAREGLESLNFNISFTIYKVIAFVAGFVLYPVVFIVWLVLLGIASAKVRKGESYRYPLTIRFLK